MGCACSTAGRPPPRRKASSVRHQLGNIHEFSCLDRRHSNDEENDEGDRSRSVFSGGTGADEESGRFKNPLRRPLAALGLEARTFDPASERDMDALRAERGPRVMGAVQELLELKARLREAQRQQQNLLAARSFQGFAVPSMLQAMPTLEVTGPDESARFPAASVPGGASPQVQPPSSEDEDDEEDEGGDGHLAVRYNPDAMLDASDLPPVVDGSYMFDNENVRRGTAAFTEMPRVVTSQAHA